jgi:hypothetical protein
MLDVLELSLPDDPLLVKEVLLRFQGFSHGAVGLLLLVKTLSQHLGQLRTA